MFVQVSDDDQRLRRVFRKMLRFTALISFPLMLGLSLVAEDFIVVLIGEKWFSSAHVLSVLCIAGMFMPIQTLYSNFIISRGKSNVNMMNTISMGLAILAMLYVEGKYKVSLFSLHGVELMVVSFVIIYVSWLLIWHYFVWREIKLPFMAAMKDTLPFLVGALAAMTAAYFAGAGLENIYLRLATRVLAAAGVYIAILYLLGAKILRESLQYLRRKKKKEQA
jgi:O-antigen/teichoic acid export membrane protein